MFARSGDRVDQRIGTIFTIEIFVNRCFVHIFIVHHSWCLLWKRKRNLDRSIDRHSVRNSSVFCPQSLREFICSCSWNHYSNCQFNNWLIIPSHIPFLSLFCLKQLFSSSRTKSNIFSRFFFYWIFISMISKHVYILLYSFNVWRQYLILFSNATFRGQSSSTSKFRLPTKQTTTLPSVHVYTQKWDSIFLRISVDRY